VRRVQPWIDATELPAGPGREAVGAPWCQEPRIRPPRRSQEPGDALTHVSEGR
jgi:hypothetical protein